MRLDRLDLVRYGKFTDRSLDFGPARPGRPDFHLVHGPNEAGKSTLFSAYLDLLFGIELKSAYGFLHPYATMRVGGRLSLDGARHELFRLKRNQGSLVAPDDRPLPDGLFAPVLGGMDRTAYRTMFSLDDESIEKGGEDILRSEGELGAMLFSASSGLSDLASGLAALKAEADDFYRPQARKHGLAALKAEIEALREERKGLDVAARDYAALVRERDAAAARHEAAAEGRNEARAALAALERSLDALPRLQRLRTLREELAAFEPGEAPPPGWRALVADLGREEAEIAARTARMETERARLAEERDALEDDRAVLDAEADIAALAGSELEARFRTAGMDLAAREAERDRLAAAIADRLAALGLPRDADARALLLPAGLGDRLTTLFSRRSGVVAEAEAARRECAQAQAALAAARTAAGGEEGDDDGAAEALSLALRATRAGDLPARLRAALREVALAAQSVEAAEARLHPWSGDAAALGRLLPPAPARLRELRTRQEAAEEAARHAAARKADLDREEKTRRAALDALVADAGLVGAGEADALRERRDAAWREHRARLDAGSADAFEQALRADDRAVAARLANADRLSELRLLERGFAEAKAQRTLAAEGAARAEEAREAVSQEIAALAENLGLPADCGLDAIEAWLARRDDALAARDALARERAQADAVEGEYRTAMARLRAALGRTGEGPETLEELLLAGEDRLAALREARAARLAARHAVEAAERRLAERQAAAQDAEAALAARFAARAAAIAGTWLAGPEAPQETGRLGALLPLLQALGQEVARRDEYEHRVAAMRRDREDYGRLAAALAGRLSEPFDTDAPTAAMAAIARRLDAAKAVARRRQDIDAARARLDAEAEDIAERRAVMRARLAEIFDFLGCDTLAEAGLRLEACARREDLRTRIAEAERDLVQQLRAGTVDEAEAQLASVDAAVLAAERETLAARLDELDREVQEQHAARRRAEEALARVAGSDEAAVLEERRRTALLELAERSRRYLATRAGVMAAEQALRLYRERHRSAMMERASKTFREITGGEYAGLSTVVEKESELLVANAAAGGSKLARDLSKGTRFQLYLALRVAGYHEIAASRETVPFIADDIMETFDDRRALNALRVMAAMAESGQVIYLTHHQHLRDLAREACPDVTIHEL
ncbi:AAA family ATPase [Shinella pollutisoli]|uniref:AAA family ATPase n=1 Tax=Shinella pollutisoli TaxID=2250594 RepID=A0ABV7DB12_9HYPH